jgi:hypothetical protein
VSFVFQSNFLSFPLLLAFFSLLFATFASLRTPFSLENELFAILRKHAKQTLFFAISLPPNLQLFRIFSLQAKTWGTP